MSDKREPKLKSPEPAHPPDHVLTALTQAMREMTTIDIDLAVESMAHNDAKWLDKLKPTPPPVVPDETYFSSNPATASFWHQQKLDLSKAAVRYANANAAAAVALQGELDRWSQAQSEYDLAACTARAVADTAVKAAADAYAARSESASDSRKNYLFHTARGAIAEALLAYQSGAANAAAPLADAAGTLLVAYTTFCASVAAAKSQLLIDQSIAKQDFWLKVEQERDDV